jgi:signal peptide peptidase SppA
MPMTNEDARALYDAAEEAGGSPLLLNAAGTWAVDFDALPQIAVAARMPTQAGAMTLASPRARDERPKSGVMVIPLTGVITPQGSFFDFLFGGSGGLAGFREQLSAAVSNDDVTVIVLDVDSPGGMADMVPETAAMVREARAVKPVVAVADTNMMSAAYWIASQAEVVVTPSGYAGSIGVYRTHVDASGLNDKMGVKVTYVSAGKYKTEGNPDEPLGRTAQRAWQQAVDDVYGDFVADVARGRGVSEDAVRSGFGEGRSLRGERAVRAGIADRVATYEEVVGQLLVGSVPPPRDLPPPDDELPDSDELDEDAEDARISATAPAMAVEQRLMAARMLTGGW